jgi:hypothetical protein
VWKQEVVSRDPNRIAQQDSATGQIHDVKKRGVGRNQWYLQLPRGLSPRQVCTRESKCLGGADHLTLCQSRQIGFYPLTLLSLLILKSPIIAKVLLFRDILKCWMTEAHQKSYFKPSSLSPPTPCSHSEGLYCPWTG